MNLTGKKFKNLVLRPDIDEKRCIFVENKNKNNKKNMVIQRLQSLYLLIAVVLMGSSLFSPFATLITDSQIVTLTGLSYPVYAIIGGLVALLLLLSIFMYKNLKRQMSVTLVNVVIILALVVSYLAWKLSSDGDAAFVWYGTVGQQILAMAFTVAAYRAMKKDKKLLSSYDRLR